MVKLPTPINHERTFKPEEVIVSKTDLKGVITYANDVFCRTALYQPHELIGQPHSIIRHPDMPRGAFRLCWEMIEAGKEFFAYVKNLASDGSFYWVQAHITPTFDDRGRIISYHSNRRCPTREAIGAITPIYQEMLKIEKNYATPNEQWKASMEWLSGVLESQGVTYDEFIWSLMEKDVEPRA